MYPGTGAEKYKPCIQLQGQRKVQTMYPVAGAETITGDKPFFKCLIRLHVLVPAIYYDAYILIDLFAPGDPVYPNAHILSTLGYIMSNIYVKI